MVKFRLIRLNRKCNKIYALKKAVSQFELEFTLPPLMHTDDDKQVKNTKTVCQSIKNPLVCIAELVVVYEF